MSEEAFNMLAAQVPEAGRRHLAARDRGTGAIGQGRVGSAQGEDGADCRGDGPESCRRRKQLTFRDVCRTDRTRIPPAFDGHAVDAERDLLARRCPARGRYLVAPATCCGPGRRTGPPQ